MKNKMVTLINEFKSRSAWKKGVKVYALELLENISDDDMVNLPLLKKAILNGADDWKMYSEGGCSLIYDGDIAERLCNPTELKKTDNGRREPNSRETWIDVQSRALYQAWLLIARLYSDCK